MAALRKALVAVGEKSEAGDISLSPHVARQLRQE